LLRPLALLIAAEMVRQALFAGSWVVLGQSALQGRFEWAIFWVWALLLLSMIPFRGLAGWAEERLNSKGTELLRQRLLFSALRLNPDRLRHAGAGTFLEKVLDVDALEGLTINGGFATLQAGVQMVVAGAVLSLGIGGAVHTLLLLLFLLYLLGAGWYHYRSYRRWSNTHREMTRDLVEQMVGHRTRLAQEPPPRRHQDEDAQLNAYLHQVGQVDGSQMLLGSGLAQAWLLIGLGWLAFVALSMPVSATALAIGLGGVLLAYQSLNQLAAGSGSLIRGLVAWHELRLIVQAEEPAGGKERGDLGIASPVAVQTRLDGRSQQPNSARTSVEAGLPLLTVHHLSFRYRPDDAPVLNGLDFSIQPGERLLLEGPSGGGKSTLGAVLAGIRRPDSGLMLLHGYDVESLGLAAWRERIVLVPQFQENFILGGSLAFNLLMGRGWPAAEREMAEAEAVCRALGLGDLLDRMPAGLLQQVGESGWQLSHGERSRIFLARAMLQRADLLILDESFGALDPENLGQTLAYVMEQAPSLLVIAHP
jgi:ATP-binding cassette subfamily B protein